MITTKPPADVDELKRAAAGRWPEIVPALTIIPAEVLDGRHHPCPKCARDRSLSGAGRLQPNRRRPVQSVFQPRQRRRYSTLSTLRGRGLPDRDPHAGRSTRGIWGNGNGKAHTTNGRAKRQPKKAADVATLPKGIKRSTTRPKYTKRLLGQVLQGQTADHPRRHQAMRRQTGQVVRKPLHSTGRPRGDRRADSLPPLCSCELTANRFPPSARSGNARHTPLRGPSIRGLLPVTWPPRKPSSTWKVSPTCWPWHRPDFLPVGLRSRTPPVPRPGQTSAPVGQRQDGYRGGRRRRPRGRRPASIRSGISRGRRRRPY